MSRRSQDIPIRPRYGLPDELPAGDEDRRRLGQASRARKTSASSASKEQVSSSYSEIPFLAQYPGAVPEHALQDVTPTAGVRPKQPPGRGDSVEEEYDEEEEADTTDESKGSSSEGRKMPKRPNSLHCGGESSPFPYELEGATGSDGAMRHFVASNLEEKLRHAGSVDRKDQSGMASQSSTPSTTAKGLLTRRYLQTQVPQIDANVLSDIEIEAQYLANSVDNLTENLCNLLHSISSITADNVEVHKNAVNKLTDNMDANIKCMYTIMAKTEEITKSMKPSEALGLRIREIKRLVDMLDQSM